MSPEQFQGLKPTAQADLYSLAVVSYEILTGARPCGGKNITTLLHQVVHEAPVPPCQRNASLPLRCDELFEKALSKEPHARFADAATFVTELNLKELEAIVSLIDAPEPGRRPPAPPTESVLEGETMDVPGAGRVRASATERRQSASPRAKGRRRLAALAGAGALPTVAGGILLSLWLSPDTVPLSIDSSPAGATIWLDGVEVGTTPVTVLERLPGTHEIIVAREGFVTTRELVRVDDAEPPAPVVLALQPARASVSVTSTPPSASVLGDGEEAGSTPIENFELPAGPHRMEVRHRSFEPWSVDVEGRLGESLHFTAHLKPRARARSAPAPPEEPPAAPEPDVAELGEPGVVPPRKIEGSTRAIRSSRASGA